MQPIGNELVNVLNINATQRVQANEQHQVIAKSIVLKDLTMF